MTEATDHPLSGLWMPNQLERMYYGPRTVEKHLISCLPSSTSKAFIITGSSLATKTSLVEQVEKILGLAHHAGTFANIKQHAPLAHIDEAADIVAKETGIDTLISIGGGSPIDSAKAISRRTNERIGRYLHHIAIPTTLSAAECFFGAGYTNHEGSKTVFADPQLAPLVILYDAIFAAETPQKLWLSTGIRALDHAVELMYHPTASEAPARSLALQAVQGLFTYLPRYKEKPSDEDYITQLQLASFNSLYPIGKNVKGQMGLSHTIGYALGSPYGIPHGITSCISLAGVVRLKAHDPASAAQVARIMPYIGQSRSGNDLEDAVKVGDAIEQLVKDLGLETTLSQYGVGEGQIPKITQMATKAEEGALYDGVYSIIQSKI